jgi:eukaryotic-like serine/threonine-protein kinase
MPPVSAPARVLSVTQDYSPTPETPPQRKPRCRVAQQNISGTGFTTELESLLRSRLRGVVTIMAVMCVLVLGRFLLQLGEGLYSALDYWSLAGVTLMHCGAAALLWSKKPLHLCILRRLELIVFGVTVLHFAQLNFSWLTHPDWISLIQATNISSKEMYHTWRNAAMNNAGRWFAVIVLYGVFIPNTGRRCAAIVGIIALIPLVLQVWAGVVCRCSGAYVLDVLPDMGIFLLGGVAVAVFGSHKFSSLQTQVYASQRLGQYQLKRRLGVGGMGEVYLAEHVLLKRPAVVKLIRADRASDGVTQARFEREVRATATLTHWNTVEIFDYGHTDDGTFYYVMEYLPGLSLQEIVALDGPMPAARAVHILQQVCKALHEAHSINLIHRDIKPSNILVGQRGGLHDVAKLLDFGLVHNPATQDLNTKLTREGYIVGTPDFMSPEQGQGAETLDARSDIYSLGAVAFFLLSGQPPFVRRTAVEAVVAHAHDPVPPLTDRGVPADVDAVIRKCLEKKPERRFQTARALDAALAKCAQLHPWTEEESVEWWSRQKQTPTVAISDESTADSPMPMPV